VSLKGRTPYVTAVSAELQGLSKFPPYTLWAAEKELRGEGVSISYNEASKFL